MKSEVKVINGNEHWTVEQFELIQLLPANGACAVYFWEDSGELHLEASPLSFIGLAKVKVLQYEKRPGWASGLVQGKYRDANRIVGIEMNHGSEMISNDCDNFCGIQMPGEKIEDCLDYMNGTDRERWLAYSKEKEGTEENA